MTGYQLTKAFYAEVEENEAMQLRCTSAHHSLYTWICELRNQMQGNNPSREILDLPTHYTMQMAFIGSDKTLKKCIDDLAEWGIIEIVSRMTGHVTKVRLAIAYLRKHCESDTKAVRLLYESDTKAMRITKLYKTTKTDKTENIYTEPASPEGTDDLEESTGDVAVEAEPSKGETQTPPQPPRAPVVGSAADQSVAQTPDPESTSGNPPPSAPDADTPAVIDTRVRHNGNGQMIKPDLPTLTAFMLEKGGTVAMAETMFDFYSSKGWLVGKSPMKDWNASARRWIRENPPNAPPGNRSGPGLNTNTPKPSTTAPVPTHQTKIR